MSETNNSRRNFLKTTGVAAAATTSVLSAAQPVHAASAGNQILEDAAYIKKLLNANYDFYEIVSMFVKERYLKKDMLAKKSKMVGEILNAQNITKYLRDYSLKLNGNDLLDKILSPIWTTESYE